MRISDWSSDVCSSDLFSVAHPVDHAVGIVRDEQGAVAGDGEAGGAAELRRAVLDQEATEEVLGRDRPAILEAHPDDLVAGGRPAVPGAVKGDEGVVAVVLREPVARVEDEGEDRKSTRLNSSH